MCMLSCNKKYNVYSFEYRFEFLNSQVVGVYDTRLKVGVHVDLLTAGGGGSGLEPRGPGTESLLAVVGSWRMRC